MQAKQKQVKRNLFNKLLDWKMYRKIITVSWEKSEDLGH